MSCKDILSVLIFRPSYKYLESWIVHLHVFQRAGFLQLLSFQLLQVVHVPPVNLEQLVHGIQSCHRVQITSPRHVGLDAWGGEAQRWELLWRRRRHSLELCWGTITKNLVFEKKIYWMREAITLKKTVNTANILTHNTVHTWLMYEMQWGMLSSVQKALIRL